MSEDFFESRRGYVVKTKDVAMYSSRVHMVRTPQKPEGIIHAEKFKQDGEWWVAELDEDEIEDMVNAGAKAYFSNDPRSAPTAPQALSQE